MTAPTSLSCPACGATASGNFCTACGSSLTPRACALCRAALSPSGSVLPPLRPPGRSRRRPAAGSSDRTTWLIAGALCLLLVGGIAYKVTRGATPAVPDMANTGAGVRAGRRNGARHQRDDPAGAI